MTDPGAPSFDEVPLPAEVEAHLRDTNPWWRNLPVFLAQHRE
ncbi:MAG: hypothetical protein ACRD3V_01585 [Vicinamibacteria bacterium]